MTAQTKIEWCDSTFNPWTGCTKISPACDHCYAESWSKRAGPKVGKWGPGAPRVRTSAANWKLPLKWNSAPFAECMDCGWRGDVSKPDPVLRGRCPSCLHGSLEPARRRVFCASLADWLDNEVDIEWFIDLLYRIMNTQNLDWLLLTKRIGNFHKRMQQAYDHLAQSVRDAPSKMLHWLKAWLDGNPPENVWLGITICNQAEADRDVPKLLATPAHVRFLSIEPMLGSIYLWPVAFLPCRNAEDMRMDPETGAYECCKQCDFTGVGNDCGIDWVIVGGESGPSARPMHPDWVRLLRDDCDAAGVAFLFKQWGEWTPGENVTRKSGTVSAATWFNDCWDFETEDLSQDDLHRDDEPDLYRVGKKAAGRLLDGVEHNGFPKVAP